MPTSPLKIIAGTPGYGIFSLSFSLAGVSVAPPSHVVAGAQFATSAVVLRFDGTTATEYNGPVTVALQGSNLPGTLSGTTTVDAVDGVATFPDLAISAGGVGYKLAATAGTLAGGTSALFQVAPREGSTIAESEQNDSLETATPLAFDSGGQLQLRGSISTSQDVDLYTLTALPGANVNISLQNLPNDYNVLLLADPTASPGAGDETNIGNVSDIGRWSIGRWSIGRWSIGRWSIGRWSIGRWSIAVSDRPGTGDEFIQTTLPRGGRYYIVVYSSNGAFDPAQPYTLSVTLQEGTLAQPVLSAEFGRGVKAQRDDGVATLFVTNSKRLGQRYPADSATRAQLDALLHHPSLLGPSHGAVLDVSVGQDPAASDRLDALYQQWDASPDQPLLANEVAQQINFLIDRAIITYYPNVENIVLVGNDDIIPFYRVPDDTELGNERDYGRILEQTANLRLTTPLRGSLHYSFYQTDDFYADRKPTPWRGRQLFLPDQAIGRLVEAPGDIVRYLATYVQSASPQPYTIDMTTGDRPGGALVSGYDFLSDQAAQIGDTLTQFGFTTDGPNHLTLLTQPGWDTNQLEATWFGGQLGQFTGSYSGIATPFSLTSINGHFTHYDALPAKLDDRYFQASRLYEPTSADTAAGYFKRDGAPTLLYSVGCHSGLSASDTAFDSPAFQADFAQAVLKQGGNWIGNTGYGIGDTDVVGYSERLALLFTRNLGREVLQDGVYVGATIGESLALAKRQYLQTSGPNGFGLADEKILNELTLYGLPFIRVKVQHPQPVAALLPPSIPDAIRPTLTASEGLFTRVITVTSEFAPLGPGTTIPAMSNVTITDDFSPTPRELIVTTATGQDQVVLPAFVYDLTLAPNMAVNGSGNPEVRGVRLRSAVTLPDVQQFDAHVTTPITDQLQLGTGADKGLTSIGQWQPALPYTFQRTSRVLPRGSELVGGRPGDVTDKLIIIPAQVKAENVQTGRLRRYQQLVFEVTYADPRTASDRVRMQTSGPVFEQVSASNVLEGTSFANGRQLTVSTHLASAPEQLSAVSVTYNAGQQRWQRAVLTRDANGHYGATLTIEDTGEVSMFFEAVDLGGNVSVVAWESRDTSVYLPLLRR